MQQAYFDSSVLISVLLGESKALHAATIWMEIEERVSSILLEAECINCLRRHFAHAGKKLHRDWMKENLIALEENLKEVTLRDLNQEVLQVIRREVLLSGCRTLDAIHLATALLFAEQADGDFHLVTFDEKMRHTAKKLGLAVMPA